MMSLLAILLPLLSFAALPALDKEANRSDEAEYTLNVNKQAAKIMSSRCLIYHSNMNMQKFSTLKEPIEDSVDSLALYKEPGLYILNNKKAGLKDIKGFCVAIPRSYYGKKWTRANLIKWLESIDPIVLEHSPSWISGSKIIISAKQEELNYGSPIYDTRTKVLHFSIFHASQLKEQARSTEL